MSFEKTIFIPIKEDSQRVRGKNFRNFGGQELWKHTVDKYVKQRIIDYNIYIDTDSDKIIEECENMSGVIAYKRVDNLCGHTVSVCDLIINCINKFDIKGPMAQIHVTTPFVEEYHVHNAIEYISEDDYGKASRYDSNFSCNSVKSRFWRTDNHRLFPVTHNPMDLLQTQDLPEFLEENSCFYSFHAEDILRTGCRIGKRPRADRLEWPYNLDIDTEDDWKICETTREIIERNKNEED